MSKLLYLIAVLIGTTATHARDAYQLTCAALPAANGKDRSYELNFQGRIEDAQSGLYVLAYRLRYDLACKAGKACRIKDQGQAAGVVNNARYQPDVYDKHVQFILGSDESTADTVQILIPQAALDARQAAFTAVLMLSGLEERYGVSLPLSCKGQAVASHVSDGHGTVQEELERARLILGEDFGLLGMRLHVDRKALQSVLLESPEGSKSLSQALISGLSQLLTDTDSPETPLLIALSAAAQEQDLIPKWPLTQEQKALALEVLRRELKQPETRLGLYTGSEPVHIAYPPEDGESPRDSWIFSLSIPTLSDHLYWVIVDKLGRRAPYVYGFN